MKKILLFAILVPFLLSCEQEVQVTLDRPVQRLVVEGRIEKVDDDRPHQQKIILSLTNDYFNSSQTPRVRGAVVSVSDDRGNVFTFVEDDTQPGTYVNADLTGEIGITYTLTIEYNNEVYEATETLLGVPPIQNIYSTFQEATLFEDEGTKVLVDFTDPADEDNYYMWEQFVNGENVLRADPGNYQSVIANDRLFNGRAIKGYLPNEETVLEPGQEVEVRQMALSKSAYDFYYLVFVETGKTGQLFDTPPASIRGNIANLTNADNYALGYFGAHGVSVRRITIEE
jgi:hypothetical protein